MAIRDGSNHPQTKLVYVDYGTENDKDGAKLMDYKTDELIERTRDRRLIDASESADDSSQGIVVAYFGIDKHWHFDRYLTEAEIRQERL